MRNRILVVCVMLLAAAPRAHAQKQKDGKTPSTPPPASAAPVPRASWTSDRTSLRVGDILTVVVDEQTAARERVSQVATGNRSQNGKIRLDNNADVTSMALGTGMNNDSRDVGEASRQGDLTAVLSVRVKSIEESGVAQIEGSRKVSVDGRIQEIGLTGVIRPEDVSPKNLVSSSRIADAVITYKGKKIGPRMGIVGKILSLLWP